MNKSNSIGAIDKTDLSEQTKFRLDEISKIENYFIEEINQRKSCSKKLSKYVAVFGNVDQALIVICAVSGGVSIILFTSIIGAPVGIVIGKVYFMFSSNNRNSQKITKYSKKQKEKGW